MKKPNEVWGYVLVGRGRMDEIAQRDLLCGIGVDLNDPATFYQDVLPQRATRPLGAMPMRQFLVARIGAGAVLHVAELLSLGVSPKDVGAFVMAVNERGAAIVVHRQGIDLPAVPDGAGWRGDRRSLDACLKAFERARKAEVMRAYRARKAKRNLRGDR